MKFEENIDFHRQYFNYFVIVGYENKKFFYVVMKTDSIDNDAPPFGRKFN